MKYVDFHGHHYGIYITFRNAYLHVVLVEDKKKVCDLSFRCYDSIMCLDDKAFAFINMSAIEDVEGLLEKASIKPTGRVKTYNKQEYAEYDFSSLLALHNKTLRRDKIRPGMMNVCEQIAISTSLVYYIYHKKSKDTFHLVTTDGWDLIIDKKYMIKAVKNYNVPVFKSFRKEPFEC